MENLFHATLRDPENSGYTWREFYCVACLERKRAESTWLIFLKEIPVTPKHLSRLYPPLVNEPVCAECSCLFRWLLFEAPAENHVERR